MSQAEQITTIQRKCAPGPEQKELFLAGGCFWGTEAYLQEARGVVDTSVGYANGHTPDPTYEAVCSHTTGYAEAVHVVYEPEQLSLSFLLELYYDSVNPTSVNRQGGDIGDQYRTGIYYTDEADLPDIRRSIDTLANKLDKPVAIEVKPLRNYYLAEEYHQNYLKKNPNGYCHIPKSKIERVKDAREYKKPEDKVLRETLTRMQYDVTQRNATEPPFHNMYDGHFEPGIYVDITTGQPLFLSTDKFQAGCGWPAFSRPIHKEDIRELMDASLGNIRTEVRSKLGDAHLGHVFEDGPADLGGLRYCINSAALRFVHRDDMEREGYGDLLPLLDR